MEAIRLKPDNAAAHFNLGLAHYAAGRFAEAESHYRRAIEQDPRLLAAYLQLGELLVGQRRLREAAECFQRAVRSVPGAAAARYDLAAVLLAGRDYGGAIGQWKAILAARPGDVQAMMLLAHSLATCPDGRFRDGRAAIEWARRAERITGGNSPEVLRVLAIVQAEADQFAQAAATARLALQLAENQHKGPLAQTLKADLAALRGRAALTVPRGRSRPPGGTLLGVTGSEPPRRRVTISCTTSPRHAPEPSEGRGFPVARFESRAAMKRAYAFPAPASIASAPRAISSGETSATWVARVQR